MPRKPNVVSKKEINDIISTIKKRGSIVIEHSVDCKNLANHIFVVTGKYISESTIKRFFGFNQSKFSPSYDTIRILNEYKKNIILNQSIGTSDTSAVEKLIIDFYNPLHFEDIDKSDSSFHAACRKMAIFLRNNPVVFQNIMAPLAKSKIGRAFYYELFPDYEILSDFQYKGYEIYLRHETTYEGKMFANCLLFLKAFFDKDNVKMKKSEQNILKLYDSTKTLHPFVLGRYYQTRLIASFLYKKSELKGLMKEVFSTEKNQPRDGRKLFREFPCFHYFACDGLWHVREYEALYNLSNIALKEYKQYKEFSWKGYYDHLYIYNALALQKMGKQAEATKFFKKINSKNFYFISKKYFLDLYNELKSGIS